MSADKNSRPPRPAHTNIRFPAETDNYQRVQQVVEDLNEIRKPGDPKISINTWILIAIERRLAIDERRLKKNS